MKVKVISEHKIEVPVIGEDDRRRGVDVEKWWGVMRYIAMMTGGDDGRHILYADVDSTTVLVVNVSEVASREL